VFLHTTSHKEVKHVLYNGSLWTRDFVSFEVHPIVIV